MLKYEHLKAVISRSGARPLNDNPIKEARDARESFDAECITQLFGMDFTGAQPMMHRS